MSQVQQITTLIKEQLKQQQITYLALAEMLGMSEANVKRMFAKQAISIKRLEQICDVLKLSIAELFLLLERKKELVTTLTREQEQQLVKDLKLLLIAVCVRDAWTMEEILQHYHINEHECIQLLARLDKLKMIELLPGNQYRLLIAQDFKWLPNGPLERYITHFVIKDFMAAGFKEAESFRFYMPGTYSISSIEILRRRLQDLTREAADLNQQDAKLPVSQRKRVGLLLAMRPWELEQFQDLRRDKSE
ncbi:MAG: helix-turn-helix transcriptional regulator [Oceanospirillaceae bacterium]|nr:helix-turn-helix transcriptional regulator [Oceanospirillaceae bacterium]